MSDFTFLNESKNPYDVSHRIIKSTKHLLGTGKATLGPKDLDPLLLLASENDYLYQLIPTAREAMAWAKRNPILAAYAKYEHDMLKDVYGPEENFDFDAFQREKLVKVWENGAGDSQWLSLKDGRIWDYDHEEAHIVPKYKNWEEFMSNIDETDPDLKLLQNGKVPSNWELVNPNPNDRYFGTTLQSAIFSNYEPFRKATFELRRKVKNPKVLDDMRLIVFFQSSEATLLCPVATYSDSMWKVENGMIIESGKTLQALIPEPQKPKKKSIFDWIFG